MAIQKTWLIEKLDCHTELNGLSNVVHMIHWRVNATDGSKTASVYDFTIVPFDDTQSFTPFEKLAEAQALKWAKDTMGAERLAEIDAIIEREIAAQPTIVSPDLPWG